MQSKNFLPFTSRKISMPLLLLVDSDMIFVGATKQKLTKLISLQKKAGRNKTSHPKDYHTEKLFNSNNFL